MRNRKLSCLLLAMILTGCGEDAEQSRKREVPRNYSDLFREIRSGIVHVGMTSIDSESGKIAVERWLGTGFLVDSNCTFITAKHILHNIDRERIAVRFEIPPDFLLARTLKVNVIYEDAEQDLAILRILKFGGSPAKSGKLHVLPLYSASPKRSLIGEAVLIVGHPVLGRGNVDKPVMRTGIVSSTEIKWNSRPMLLLDLHGVPGFSGSPVTLARSGDVVGVVYGPGPTEPAFGFEWATPVSKDFYRRALTVIRTGNGE